MTANQIHFTDGAAYERYMGKWSQLVGDVFLDWLALPPALRWLDVGCGNGAFTALLLERCAPASVDGIDPSEQQIAYARARFTAPNIAFQQGDAMALPFPDNSFDAAVMPLVIFFVPEPARGVAEMARVVGPGGTVTAYAWDLYGGGFPYFLIQEELRALGYTIPAAPSAWASRLETMQTLWAEAGLSEIETTTITVQRSFANFDEYWAVLLGGSSVAAILAALPPEDTARVQGRMRELLPADASGRMSYSARANAIKGRVF